MTGGSGIKVRDPKLLMQLWELDAAEAQRKEELAKSPLSLRVPFTDIGVQVNAGKAGRYVENVGAGMDNVVQGAKQLAGMGDPDEVIQERRRIKGELGDSVPGGGVAQFAGELTASALPVAGVGSAAAALGARALPKTAAWMAAQGGRAASLGTVGRGVVEGAAGGALNETTTDESKGLHAGLGAAFGGAVPLGVAGLAKIKRMLAKSNAPERAGALIERTIGKDNVSQVDDVLDSPMAPPKLPLSTAARANNPALAALERGSRRQGRADWAFEHDRLVNDEANNLLRRATSNADEVEARTLSKDEWIEAAKDMLNKRGSKKNMTSALNDVSSTIKDIRRSPVGRQIPELNNEIGKIESLLAHQDAKAGDFATQYWRVGSLIERKGITPEHREALRQLQASIAMAADKASGGSHFSDMLGMVAAQEAHVGEAAASRAIRESFLSPQGVAKTPGATFGAPEISSSNLRKTLAAKGEKGPTSSIDSATRKGLEELEGELRRHELWKAGNSPGASSLDEAANPVTTFGSGANNPFNRIWAARGVSNVILRGSREDTAAVVDAALQKPEVWQKVMEQYRKSKSPLTPEEFAERVRRQMILSVGRAGSAGMGGEQ